MIIAGFTVYSFQFQYALFLLLIFLLEAITGVLAYMYDGVVSKSFYLLPVYLFNIRIDKVGT